MGATAKELLRDSVAYSFGGHFLLNDFLGSIFEVFLAQLSSFLDQTVIEP